MENDSQNSPDAKPSPANHDASPNWPQSESLLEASERISQELDQLSENTSEWGETTRQRFRQLWVEARSGSEDAAEQMVKEFRQSILAVIRRHLSRPMRRQFDSEDLLQTIWKSLFIGDSHREFDKSEDLRAFVHQVAKNKSIDKYRQHVETKRRDIRREVPVSDLSHESNNQLDHDAPTPSRVISAREECEQLFEGQPSQVCEAVEMRADGMTFEEIAERTGLHKDSVRRMLRRLKARMESKRNEAG